MKIDVRVRDSPNGKKRRGGHKEYGHRCSRAADTLHAHEGLADVTNYTLFAIVHIFSHLGAAVGDEDYD